MFQHPPLKYLPPFIKVIALFSLMMLSMQIMFLLGAFLVHQFFGVADTELFVKDIGEQAKNPVAALILQGLGSGLGAFALPALMFSVLSAGNIGDNLRLNCFPDGKQLLLAVGITLSAGVFVSLLVELNKMIPLPESLSALKTMQKKYEMLIEAFFEGAGIKRFLLMVFVLAVLPALGEELFFRGLVQKILSQTVLGAHGAVLVTAVAFSVMHFEFDNLLAIFCMGAILGYLYIFTQSLWTSIAAHFLNNFIQVLLKFLFASGILKTDITESDELPLFVSLSAGLLMFGLIVLLYKLRTPELAEADEHELQ